MEKNEEITISEAKKITGELKASILKLEALNVDVVSNIEQLQELNQKMKDYTSVLNRFDFKDEKEMSIVYSSYLSFISKKLDELGKNSSLKKLEFIIENSNRISNIGILKLALIVAMGLISVLLVSLFRA